MTISDVEFEQRLDDLKTEGWKIEAVKANVSHSLSTITGERSGT